MKNEYKKTGELIWALAITDFKLRFQGSVLGYIWSIIKPLILFTVIYVVFNSVFNFKSNGNGFYGLELLTGLLIFNFFIETVQSGMNSFVQKSGLLTKIYIPKWTIIVAATLNSFFIFLANIIVLAIFFGVYGVVPSGAALLIFLFLVMCLYGTALGLSFLLAPWYVRFRDIGMIWEVVVSLIMYASPIIYPLSFLPESVQKIVLINPVAFTVHFSKQALIYNHRASIVQLVLFLGMTILFLWISIIISKKSSRHIVEQL